MGLLEPYRGTYCSASSASEKIDVQAILAGCDAVDAEANHISEYAGNLSDYSSQLDANALSVDGKTMISTANEYWENINNVESEIINTTAYIREAAEAVYNQIQEQMNQEAHARDEYEYNRRKNGG